jgi:hypothetical protein
VQGHDLFCVHLLDQDRLCSWAAIIGHNQGPSKQGRQYEVDDGDNPAGMQVEILDEFVLCLL